MRPELESRVEQFSKIIFQSLTFPSPLEACPSTRPMEGINLVRKKIRIYINIKLFSGLSGSYEDSYIFYEYPTDLIYVTTGSGLFYIRPNSTAFIKVEKYESVTAMGFDYFGNIYLGNGNELQILEPC